jgi:hypothetical protein
MKFEILLIGSLIALAIASCSPDKSSENPPCPAINLDVYGDTTVVAGDSIQLFATPLTGASYSWTGPFDFISNNPKPVIVESSSLNEGYYYAQANINGLCESNIDSFYVTVLCDRPEDVRANYYTTVNVNDSIKLFAYSVTDTVQYVWYGPSGFTSNQQNPVIPNAIPGNQGTYVVYAFVDHCYSKPDSVNVIFNQCNPAANTFASSNGENAFLYSYGSASLYPNTQSITGTGLNGSSQLRATFYGNAPAAGNYLINPAHCPASGTGALLPGEVCLEFTNNSGTFQAVNGTVKLINSQAFSFCSVPFRLQFTTATLFNGSGKVQF